MMQEELALLGSSYYKSSHSLTNWKETVTNKAYIFKLTLPDIGCPETV